MKENTEEKVRLYVEKNYPKLFNKGDKPIIKEFDNHYQISKMEDSSPLILGKNIINK